MKNLKTKKLRQLKKTARPVMRSAFTLLEMIFVIAVLALLVYLNAGKIFGSFGKTEMQTAIANDVDVMATSVFDFKLHSPYATPEGTYGGIGAEYVARPMTDKMAWNDDDGTVGNNQFLVDYIESMGVGGGCHYFFASDTPTGGNADHAFKVFMDCSVAIVNKGWSTKEATRAEDVFIKGFQARSLVPVTIYTDATGVGSANTAPDVGGTLTDGMVAVVGIVN